MKNPITQSKEWQKLQEDLNETSIFEKSDDFHYLAIIKPTPVGNYLFIPYGPVAKDTLSFKKAINSIKKLAEKNNSVFIRIEPLDPDFIKILPKNVKKTKDINPKDTWILDLSKDKDEIILGFSHGVRNGYNTYKKRGLSIEKTRDEDKIKELVKLQKDLAKNKHIGTFSENYLKTELKQPFATLYLVKYNTPDGREKDVSSPEENEIIAASLFFDYKDTRYYMQSAAKNGYKRLPSTVALLAESILDAKEKGIKYFNFWGIAPEDAPKNHPWAGFTKFKKSFGGFPEEYAGTYDIILKPVRYKSYQIIRKINRLLRKAV